MVVYWHIDYGSNLRPLLYGIMSFPACEPLKRMEADTFSPVVFEPDAGSRALSSNLSQVPVKRSLQSCQNWCCKEVDREKK